MRDAERVAQVIEEMVLEFADVATQGPCNHLVDTGKRSVIIEPLNEPHPGERWTLRVPLADKREPEVAELSLIAHPSVVDTEIDV